MLTSDTPQGAALLARVARFHVLPRGAGGETLAKVGEVRQFLATEKHTADPFRGSKVGRGDVITSKGSWLGLAWHQRNA